MSAKALLKRFDIVADQPANVPAVRRLVVDLAVRGKLLAAGELDMDVQEMLRRISSKADDLVSAGAIKKQKPMTNIGDDEVPAAYLAHCTFARLGNIANLQKGLTGIQSSTPGEYPLVVTSAERGTCDHFDFDSAAAIIPLVSSTGHGNASINRLHYQEGRFALGTILCAVFPFDESLISARFLYEYLTAFKEELLVSKMIGTANVTLTLGKIAEVPVPILAPAVQRRVDELMAMCDQLEAAQLERERRRDYLATASLQRLNQPAADTTPATQREHARFHLQHLPRLITRPQHIKALRQTIFSLAVRGQLLHQKAGNRPRPGSQKQQTQSKVGFGSPVFSEALALMAVPEHWAILPLASVAEEIVDCPHSTPVWASSGKICVRTSQFRPGYLDLSTARFVSQATYIERIQRLLPMENDILYSREGGILGIACRVPQDVELCLGQRMMLIRAGKAISPAFLELVLNSPLITDIARGRTTGGAAPRINVATVKAYPIPLPPLAEQHRIVAKVDELMVLCDQLEAQLRITQTDSRRLLEAVLEVALTA